MPKSDHNPVKMKKAAAEFFGTEGNQLVVKSKLKGLIASMGLRMDGDLPDELSKRLVQEMFRSAMRAVENKRSTIKPCDL